MPLASARRTPGRRRGRRRRAAQRQRRAAVRADARAAEEGRLRRLLDQRRDAARARAGRAAARDRRAARRGELSERLGERRRARRGRRARASSTSSSPTPGTSAPLRGRAGGRRRLGRAARREQPEKVLIEFVSANPTGPLTAASGRHAAYGDALARLLELAGHAVAREYYFNDAGSQVDRLGESIRARARGEAVPEDGYQGEYVAELAAADPGRRRRRRRGPRPRRASR